MKRLIWFDGIVWGLTPDPRQIVHGQVTWSESSPQLLQGFLNPRHPLPRRLVLDREAGRRAYEVSSRVVGISRARIESWREVQQLENTFDSPLGPVSLQHLRMLRRQLEIEMEGEYEVCWTRGHPLSPLVAGVFADHIEPQELPPPRRTRGPSSANRLVEHVRWAVHQMLSWTSLLLWLASRARRSKPVAAFGVAAEPADGSQGSIEEWFWVVAERQPRGLVKWKRVWRRIRRSLSGQFVMASSAKGMSNWIFLRMLTGQRLNLMRLEAPFAETSITVARQAPVHDLRISHRNSILARHSACNVPYAFINLAYPMPNAIHEVTNEEFGLRMRSLTDTPLRISKSEPTSRATWRRPPPRERHGQRILFLASANVLNQPYAALVADELDLLLQLRESLADSELDLTIRIRPHPQHPRWLNDLYERAFPLSPHWMEPVENDLAWSDVVLGTSSSVLVDAARSGLRAISIAPAHYDPIAVSDYDPRIVAIESVAELLKILEKGAA
jgi:hypothetical protein